MVQKVPGHMLEDGAVADAATGLTVGNYVRVGADGSFEERTPAEVRSDIGAVATDPTITALAGTAWAANAVPIGNGADTLSQVPFAANTFPARSSSGNLVAKAITDFGLSILDDANAAAVLATLGIPTLAHGTYTPVITNGTNVSASTSAVCQYLRIGNTVTVSGVIQIDPIAAAGALTGVSITLPIASALTLQTQVGGAGVGYTLPYEAVGISAAVAVDGAAFEFGAQSTSLHPVTFSFTYLIL